MTGTTARNRIEYRRPRGGGQMSSLATVDSSAQVQPRVRQANDWYVEEAWAVDAFFKAERFDGAIYDPAAGGGNIVRRAWAAGYEASGSDLIQRAPDIRGGWDYLRLGSLVPRPDNVVCNPPFDHAEEFVAQALKTVQRKAAFLLRWTFAEGGTGKRDKSKLRRWLLDEAPLARTYPYANRVCMPPGGSDAELKGGAVCFAWFVWEIGYSGPRPFTRLYRERA